MSFLLKTSPSCILADMFLIIIIFLYWWIMSSFPKSPILNFLMLFLIPFIPLPSPSINLPRKMTSASFNPFNSHWNDHAVISKFLDNVLLSSWLDIQNCPESGLGHFSNPSLHRPPIWMVYTISPVNLLLF